MLKLRHLAHFAEVLQCYGILFLDSMKIKNRCVKIVNSNDRYRTRLRFVYDRKSNILQLCFLIQKGLS